jgi:hypothetical protein
MNVGFYSLIVIPALASCTGADFTHGPSDGWTATSQETPGSGSVDFDWLLTGDRAVAPLQVFNDENRTWLQFGPGQILPAIFAVTSGREQPVHYRLQSPYAVIDGRWPEFVMHGGGLTAYASHGGAAHVQAAFPPMPLSAPKSPLQDKTAAAQPLATSVTSIAPPSTTFDAGPDDVNMRRALTRWAQLSGWTFATEHWTLDADIPLAGAADLGVDFKVAVNRLLETTELGDRPAHPCFYSNRVLRVVPLAEACDRAAGAFGALS